MWMRCGFRDVGGCVCGSEWDVWGLYLGAVCCVCGAGVCGTCVDVGVFVFEGRAWAESYSLCVWLALRVVWGAARVYMCVWL